MTTPTITLDINDFIKFAPLARKVAGKKGLLKEIKIGIENPKAHYYCLFGNILYSFESENDFNSLIGIYFLEGSTCKVTTTLDNQLNLAITLVGGKKISFASTFPTTTTSTIAMTAATSTGAVGGGGGLNTANQDLQEWMESIESNKHIQISRKLDDYESQLLQLQHKTEQNEAVHAEYEQTIADLQKTIRELTVQSEQSQSLLKHTQQEKYDLQKRLKDTETDRLLLLKSRGITPKTLPLWALQDNSRKGISDPIEKLRLWTGSWNLSGKEPFLNIPTQKATNLLLPFIPKGYDVYVLAVQDCPSDSLFECMDTLLAAEGLRRFRLENTNLVNQGNASSNTSEDGNNTSTDPSKIISRSDGRFLGIVIYIKFTLFSDIKLLSITNQNLSTGSTLQGAVAIALALSGRNVVFINSKFDHKSNEQRREQYQQLMMSLGASLAEYGYHLNEQFHHIIWFGDFSFKIVDTSGNDMPVDTIMNMLSDPRLVRTLFETHDQLNQEKKLHNIFYGYREPVPFPNFFPTYKKIENRPPVNYSRPDWAKNTYKVYIKDSFFKGGKTKEFTPQFSDRILFYSMSDLAEDLLPESVPSEMYILRDSDDKEYSRVGGNGSSAVNGTGVNSNNYLTTVVDSAKLSVQVDNYRSVNDGEGMTASDHSPVFCTFVLRVRHDHSSLIEAKAKLQSVHGDINDVLSVLSNNSVKVEEGLSKSPQKKSYLLDYSSIKEPTTPSTPTKGSLNRLLQEEVKEEIKSSGDVNEAVIAAPFSPFSLLPHGIYHVRISDMKLIWGINEEFPSNVQILFPAPFEAIAGERFVEYREDETSSFASSGVYASPIKKESSARTPSVTPTKSPNGSGVGIVNQWKRLGPSKSGTCVRLGIDRANESVQTPVPNLVLTWRGDEPLDRLHISIKAAMLSKSIVTQTRSSRSSGKIDPTTLHSIDNDDKVVGHCSISLEQLCKVALANAATSASSVAAPRILIHRGRPMHNLDAKTLQREIVTFCCKLELLH